MGVVKIPVLKGLLLAVAGAFFLLCWVWLIPDPPGPAFELREFPPHPEAPFFEELWISDFETREAHSANVVLVQDRPVAVWYGGTEEGHRDVAIFIASFDGQWSAPLRVIDRTSAEQGLGRYIRKIGNPALHAWPDGSLGLYFVTVSVGGWAASSVNYMESRDLGNTWSQPQRLVTSPFLNISTLVRKHALPLQDGTITLPVYHEFMGKFAETLRLDRQQTVLAKRRISRGKHSLQPDLLPRTSLDAEAWLRYSGTETPRLLRAQTHDGGRHWTKPVATRLPNPDAAISILRLDTETALLAFNDTEDGRHRLSLAVRQNGEWQTTRVIEQEEPEGPNDHTFEFSYPSLVMSKDGSIHLVYTWNQRRIKHLHFNRAWLGLAAAD